jgi:hypothetical protein
MTSIAPRQEEEASGRPVNSADAGRYLNFSPSAPA